MSPSAIGTATAVDNSPTVHTDTGHALSARVCCEVSSVAVRRVMPVLQWDAAQENREFYGLLGLEEVMNLGWITTLASPSAPAAQVSFMAGDEDRAGHAGHERGGG
jgi:hypothetical protein